ncbi:MAG: hypothetical protein OSB10_10975, partial [Planctomycetota bacterium]|nr:hypothetical protein [Planctomycetota bacterium]
MARPRLLPSLLLLSLPMLGVASCGSDDSKGGATEDAGSDNGSNAIKPGGKIVTADVLIPMVTYTWDNTLGDAGVSADMGGPGFTGEGWTTNMEFQAIGSADAIKGGSLKRYLTDWPATLRQHGKDWNSSLNYLVADLCYEGLLGFH